MTLRQAQGRQANLQNPWLDKLEVIAVHPNHTPGNVNAFVTIQIGQALELHGVKIVQQAGQRAYVRLPDVQSAGRWFPVLRAIDTRFQEALSSLVLKAWAQEVLP